MTTQKATILDAETKDGLENLIAQLGTSQDKRNSSTFVNNKRLSQNGNQGELEALYETDWLAGKIVDIIPDDMTREWRAFTGEIDPDIIDTMIAEEERLDLVSNFNQAHKWSRLYGTAFIVMNIDDGQTPDKPLDINKIKEGSLKHIKTVDRHMLSTNDVIPVSDPMSKNFGMPEFYRFHESNTKIHCSRVLRFDGVKLPYRRFRENNYNSNSVLDRLYEALTNLNTTANSAASMVYETNVDIFKVKGLMGYLQSAEGESLLRKRFTLANVMKSFNNSIILDNEEEHISKTNTFAGLPDLLDRYGLYMSAASDIPATRLLGSSASGLNATGEGDLKNYYDTIRAAQKTIYKPKLDYFDDIMKLSLGIADDADISYMFNSLFQMTPKEEADMQYVTAQRDDIYLNQAIVTPSMVAKELRQNETYTNIEDEYITELEEYENDPASDTDNIITGIGAENEEGEKETNNTGEDE